jgi:SPP1 family predicted phage head-tail adaptor
MLQAGKLRKRVTVKVASTGQNEFGEQTHTYTTYATVWAGVRPLQGRELSLAQQVNAEVSSEVTMRYDSSKVVLPTYRIGIGTSRELEVVNVINPEEKNEFVRCLCKEII